MDELTDSMQDALHGMGKTIHLMLDARSSRLSETGETTMEFRGETRAEALGHSYHLRDELRENGYQAECEYVGLADEQPDWSDEPRHEVRISWSEE